MPDWTNSQGQIVYNSDSPPAFGGPWWQATPDEVSKGQQGQQGGAQQGYQVGNQYFQPKNTQQFGGLPQTINPGGQIGAPDPNAIAASLTKTMGRKAPTIAGADFSGMQNTQQSQMGVLGQLQGYAQGLGPSAAQVGNTMAMGQAAQAARAGLAGGNSLASRAALGVQQSALGGAAMQGASARGQEQAGAMNAYGGAAGGLAQNSLGASALANQQIEQQQALGLGQAQRNYGLAQGTIGTALDEQTDIGKYDQAVQQLYQQKQTFNNQQTTQDIAAAAQYGAALAAL